MNKMVAALMPVAIAGLVALVAWRTGTPTAEMQLLWPVAIAASAALLIGYPERRGTFLAEAREVEDRFVRRLDEVTLAVREALRDGELLRKGLDRFAATQQGVVEKAALAAEKAAEAAKGLASRDAEEVRRAQDRARAAERVAEDQLEILMDTHGSLSLCLVVAPRDTSTVLAQLRTELELRLRGLGIEVFGSVSTPLDGSLHNVIGSSATADPSADRQVAIVRKPGFRRGPEVLRRADVVASLHQPPPPVPETAEPGAVPSAEASTTPTSRASVGAIEESS